MNKLACIAIILLGFMLLFTHLAVTLIIGTAHCFVISTHFDAENSDIAKQGDELAKQLAAAIRQTFDPNKINAKDVNCTLPEEDLNAQTVSFEQNDIEKLTKSLNETSKPVCIKYPTISVCTEGPTIKFPLCISIYGLVGSLIIISGTIFLSVLALKKLKPKENRTLNSEL